MVPSERVAGGRTGPETHPDRGFHVGYRFARANEPDNMPPVGFPVADHAPSAVVTKPAAGGIRFDRNELSGAFGDIGTDLPLVFGLILAARLDTASVLVLFGAMQLVTALAYRMPMPVQPLKAMAALVITQKLSGDLLYGAGLAIGFTMLLLTVTGLVDWLARVIPPCVVRGIQFGLGLQLALLALKEFVPADGANGFVLAALGFLITILLLGNRRLPPAMFVIGLGLIYAVVFKFGDKPPAAGIGFRLPQFHAPGWSDVLGGFLLLGLPQIPLSLGNSILATRQLTQDLFPERALTTRKISFTYSLMNLVNPWFGGVPTCHGSGGMAGHYAFGARTGGSVIIYGSFFLIAGLFFGGGFDQLVLAFPKPILGVLLFFEGLTLLVVTRDAFGNKTDGVIVALVGLMAGGLKYGFLAGPIVGTAMFYLMRDRLDRFGK